MIKIFVCYHKYFPIFDFIKNSKILELIQVGKEKANFSLSMIGDNIGDNISNKNEYYCELTAQYWAWKNCNSDHVGIFHYRRFLNFNDKSKRTMFFLSPYFKGEKYLNDEVIKLLCSKYDIILPQAVNMGNKSLYQQYKTNCNITNLEEVFNIVKEKYPYMSRDVEEVAQKKDIYFYNIFIMNKKYFNDYSRWLFDVLFELERRLKAKNHRYDPRLFGFLGERLLNVYMNYIIRTDNPRIKELYVLFGYNKRYLWVKEILALLSNRIPFIKHTYKSFSYEK